MHRIFHLFHHLHHRRQRPLLSIALLCALAGAALARDLVTADAFTNESLAGRYALTLTGKGGRAPTAGIGVLTLDAQGNLSGYTIVNLPEAQATSQRHFREIPLRGTYIVNADGAGKIFLLEEAVTEATFSVTKVERRWLQLGDGRIPGALLAQELTVIGKNPGAFAGNLITATLRRLPEGNDAFTAAAQAGQLSIVVSATGGAPATAGQIRANLDAQGNFNGTAQYNIVNQQTGERTFIEFPTGGTFTVNPDGTGKLSFTGAGVVVKEAVFVITQAERRAVRFGNQIIPGEKIALEIALVAKELNLQGHLLTGVSTRLPE